MADLFVIAQDTHESTRPKQTHISRQKKIQFALLCLYACTRAHRYICICDLHSGNVSFINHMRLYLSTFVPVIAFHVCFPMHIHACLCLHSQVMRKVEKKNQNLKTTPEMNFSCCPAENQSQQQQTNSIQMKRISRSFNLLYTDSSNSMGRAPLCQRRCAHAPTQGSALKANHAPQAALTTKSIRSQ